ncbi:MAG: AAA-like domain-containing protein [Polyangiales bacterium]
MARWFNIAGPCFAREHYMIPVERRAATTLALIEQGRWFSLVSGRQTGKTTVVKHLAKSLTARGDRLVLWVDLQVARDQTDPAVALRAVFGALANALTRAGAAAITPTPDQAASWLAAPESALQTYLSALCAASPHPVVLLLDEADVMAGAAVVTFLTQLRALYLARDEQPAPASVVLIGVRSVRDDAVTVEERRTLSWLGSASPFNVTVENVTLAAFTPAEVAELTAQHTAETAQRFYDAANALIWELSQGHPWLVNALADQATRRDVTDRAVAITAEHVERAKETIIVERRTHIDSLLARLREERVRRVLDPMMAGETLPASGLDDDLHYVAGLGLIRVERGQWQVANPIYREVIPRALTYVVQTSLYQFTAWYLRPDGLLDVPKLLAAWQEFWREDGHVAAEGFTYRESGPHLMLMAFLQRIVNGGGRIDREYALGKDALDLLVTWKTQRIALELKVRHRPTTEAKGLAQLAGYLDALGLDEGWLVLFDQRADVPWDERVFTRTEAVGPRRIHVIGC